MSFPLYVTVGSATVHTGSDAPIAAVNNAWVPVVDVYVDQTNDPLAQGTIIKVFGFVGTIKKVQLASGVFTGVGTGDGQRVLTRVQVPIGTTFIYATARSVLGTVTLLRMAIVGWDPNAQTANAADAFNTTVALTPSAETTLGTLPWHPFVNVSAQGTPRAQGTVYRVRAVFDPLTGFVSSPVVASGTYQDDTGALTCEAVGGAPSWKITGQATTQASGNVDILAQGNSPGGSFAGGASDAGGDFVFQPGGTRTGNIYPVWADLVTAANAYPGPARIWFDVSHNGGTCSIPAGTWAFTNPWIEWFGSANILSGTPVSILGSVSPLPARITDIILDAPPGISAPSFSITSGVINLYLVNSTIQSDEVSQPLIRNTGATLGIGADVDSIVGGGFGPAVATSLPGFTVVNGALDVNAFSGPTAAFHQNLYADTFVVAQALLTGTPTYSFFEPRLAWATVAADATLVVGNGSLRVDSSAALRTITFPAGAPDGDFHTVKLIAPGGIAGNPAAHNVHCVSAGSDTFEQVAGAAASSFDLSTIGESITFTYDASNTIWRIT